MTAVVDLALEGAAAGYAGEGFDAGVFAAVSDEVGGLTERLSAATAFVGFLSWKYTKVADFE